MVKTWTKEEEEALYDGYKKYGCGNWKLILSDPQFASSLRNRSNANLKEKWRRLKNSPDWREEIATPRMVKNWTKEEEQALHDGVKKHGCGNWKLILSDPQFSSSLCNRSNANLKDKWRRMKVRCDGSDWKEEVEPPRMVKNWTKDEEQALYDGVKKHGCGNWKLILSDPQFASSLRNRSNANLKDKWRKLKARPDWREKVATPRKDKMVHPPPRSRKRRRKKKVVEEQSDHEDFNNSEDNDKFEDYDNQYKVTLQRRRRKKKVVEEQSDYEDFNNSEDNDKFEDYDNQCKVTRLRRGTRNNLRNQARKLNSEKVHSYLENLWLRFPEDKKSAFTHFDPLWYTLYSSDSQKDKVLNWIKKKDIFSKKYVFFPIVCWGHWSVLIFCHFGETLGSKFRTPCILLLDSLAKADHSKQLEPVVRKFVLDIYVNLERTEDKALLRKMPFLVPKVPQQRDGEECGFFVLYYIKLFVESAPENFSVTNGYPYFMKKDWFNCEGVDNFCRTLDSSHM